MPSSLTMLLPSALGFSPHPPVSVYGTGAWKAIAAFLGRRSARFATLSSLRVARPAFWHVVFPPCRLARLHRFFHPRPALPVRVPAVLSPCGTGIYTCCPSATRLRLALGPDFPRADQLYPGNLGYSAGGILTPLSLLIPAFSLPMPPPPLTGAASPALGMLPYRCALLAHPAASAARLSPGHFRRGDSRLVSCYALFECVAASEPTS